MSGQASASDLNKLNALVRRQNEQLSFLLLTQTALVRAIGKSSDVGLKDAVHDELQALFVKQPGADALNRATLLSWMVALPSG